MLFFRRIPRPLASNYHKLHARHRPEKLKEGKKKKQQLGMAYKICTLEDGTRRHLSSKVIHNNTLLLVLSSQI